MYLVYSGIKNWNNKYLKAKFLEKLHVLPLGLYNSLQSDNVGFNEIDWKLSDKSQETPLTTLKW